MKIQTRARWGLPFMAWACGRRETMKTWNAVALVVLLGVCVWNVVGMVVRVPPPSRVAEGGAENSVVRHEARMAALRRAMERHTVTGTVGYLTDLPPAALAGDARGMGEYFLTQFALTPRVLDPRDYEREWIVANLRTATIDVRGPPGYRVAENCGGGVWLLRKETRVGP